VSALATTDVASVAARPRRSAGWVARLLASLDRALAGSAEGSRGL